MRAANHQSPRRDGLDRATALLGDRWTILVLREAFYGVRRYGDLVRNLGIARNVLAARLKTLVADGLLERRRYRTEPDWYEYVLTDAGRDLYGAILALLHWADVHLPVDGRAAAPSAAPLVWETDRSQGRLLGLRRGARSARGRRRVRGLSLIHI